MQTQQAPQPEDSPAVTPAFLCIGAQKAGTSWLYVQLARHPGVWMPPVKELHFFDHVYVEANRKWTTAHIQQGVQRALKYHLSGEGPVDWGFVRYLSDMATHKLFTKPWYLRCFDRPRARSKVCGDITPEYSTIPLEGVQHVKRMLPDVKLIYIVRDPVERALSQLRMNVERKGGAQPSEDQLLRMVDHPDIDNRGDYQTYIPRWRQVFAPDRLLMLPYGDIRNDPLGLLRRIEQFIGVAEFSDYDLQGKVHETRKFPMPASVTDKLRSRYASQYAFLNAELGPEFVARAR
jgi:hypothetical protein